MSQPSQAVAFVRDPHAQEHSPASPLPASPPPAGQGSLDVGALTRLLDGEYADTKQQVRQLLRQPLFRYNYDLDRAAYRDKVMEWCRELARHGLGKVCLPDETGQADIPRFFSIFETLGHFDINLAVKTGVQFGLFGGSIFLLGTRRHHERYLDKVGTLELPGCFAMTEFGHGSNIRSIETTATFDPGTDTFVIHTPTESARKVFIGNLAVYAQMATVFAHLETGGQRHGVFGFLVPLRDSSGNLLPGVEIGDLGAKVGLNGIDNGWLRLNQVRVPRENLLNRLGDVSREGTYQPVSKNPTLEMLTTMIEGRVSIALASLSAAKTGLAINIRYAARRRQFGSTSGPERLLLDYPAYQRRLLPRLAAVYALDAGLKHLVANYRNKTLGPAALEGQAAVLKARATWNAIETLQACREACGGQGYLSVNRIGMIRADVDAWTTLEGDNTLMLLLCAKELLKSFHTRLKEGGTSALLRALTRRFAAKARWKNPLAAWLGSPASLGEAGTQQALLRYREQEELWRCARLIERSMRRGRSIHDAFAEHGPTLLRLAEAHTDRLVLEQFVQQIESCPDPSVRRVLERLRELHALSRLEATSAWYLQERVLTGRGARWIDERIGVLCAELRDFAEPLVDAFAIPDELLAAPIALGQPSALSTTPSTPTQETPL